MTAIMKYKPLIIFMIAALMVFAFLGNAFLQADEDHADDDVHESDESSIVGSFFHFVGDVIAFPFRIIGKALDAIF